MSLPTAMSNATQACVAAMSMTMPNHQASIDARMLPDIIEAYFVDKSPHIDPQTQFNYRAQLLPWNAFWESQEAVHHFTLSPQILTAAHDWIRGQHKNSHGRTPHPTTIFNCFTRVRGVFNWAFRHNCTGNVNVADWCPKLRRGESDLYFPTIDELGLMLTMPCDEYRLRDVAMIAWLTSTGARLFETAEAMADDVHFNSAITDLTVGHDHAGYCHLRLVKGDNKGERGGRHVAFCVDAGLMLKCYLRSVPRGPSDTVFSLSDKGVAQAVRRHAERAGLPDLSPHAFRRLFSDHWDETYKMDHRMILKKQLGHSLDKSDVTEGHYLNSKNRRRIIGALQEFHVSPLARLKIDWAKFPVNIESTSD